MVAGIHLLPPMPGPTGQRWPAGTPTCRMDAGVLDALPATPRRTATSLLSLLPSRRAPIPQGCEGCSPGGKDLVAFSITPPIVRKRECMSQKRDAVYGFLSE